MEEHKMKKCKVNKSNRKIGRNVYGDPCIVKKACLQKENAFEEYIKIINDIEAHRQKGLQIEYTVSFSEDFTTDEIKAGPSENFV